MNAAARHMPGACTPDLVPHPQVALATAGAPLRAVTPEVANGDAISEVWKQHGSALMRFALKLTLGDQQRAEDIIQETLVRAWRHPNVMAAGPTAIRPWLFTVTRHIAIDLWRGRSRGEEPVEDQPTERADPIEYFEQVVTALDVRAALAQLTAEHRQVIVAMYYYGRSVAEISQALSIPAGTVKSRAYYGLRRLRNILSAERAAP
jgi:RNA polymerase sigma-70 factor, ECF subfamily